MYKLYSLLILNLEVYIHTVNCVGSIIGLSGINHDLLPLSQQWPVGCVTLINMRTGAVLAGRPVMFCSSK